MTIRKPPRPAGLAHGPERARRGCQCHVCRPTPVANATTQVSDAVLRHLDALGVTDRQPAMRLAAIIESDAHHNRLRHRAAMAELVEILGKS